MGKYKGSIAEVNDPDGRRVVKSRTTTAPPAHSANIDKYIVPVGATGEWSTHVGEIALDNGAAWLYEAAPPDGLIIWVADENLGFQCVGNDLQLAHKPYLELSATDFRSPNNSDWAVNALAASAVDSNDAGRNVRLWDDTIEQGVGTDDELVPKGTTKVNLRFSIRAETAPAAARTGRIKVYNRDTGAWTAGFLLNDINIGTDENWIEFSHTVDLVGDLIAAADTLTQFEFTRVAPGAGINLEGHLVLRKFRADWL